MPQEIAYDAQNITPAEINSATFIPVVINYVQEAVAGAGEGKGGLLLLLLSCQSCARVCVCVLKLK